MTWPSETTVGRYWVDGKGRVWKHISYAAQPTATLELVGTSERKRGVVGSPILEEFRLLVPEDMFIEYTQATTEGVASL
jgi:hypothetical protein